MFTNDALGRKYRLDRVKLDSMEASDIMCSLESDSEIDPKLSSQN